jgi:hypothetical protein
MQIVMAADERIIPGNETGIPQSPHGTESDGIGDTAKSFRGPALLFQIQLKRTETVIFIIPVLPGTVAGQYQGFSPVFPDGIKVSPFPGKGSGCTASSLDLRTYPSLYTQRARQSEVCFHQSPFFMPFSPQKIFFSIFLGFS